MKRKTSVRSYERRDGTKVSAHDRTIDASDLPKYNSDNYFEGLRSAREESYRNLKQYHRIIYNLRDELFDMYDEAVGVFYVGKARQLASMDIEYIILESGAYEYDGNRIVLMSEHKPTFKLKDVHVKPPESNESLKIARQKLKNRESTIRRVRKENQMKLKSDSFPNGWEAQYENDKNTLLPVFYAEYEKKNMAGDGHETNVLAVSENGREYYVIIQRIVYGRSILKPMRETMGPYVNYFEAHAIARSWIQENPNG
jgi:hypothetical protein